MTRPTCTVLSAGLPVPRLDRAAPRCAAMTRRAGDPWATLQPPAPIVSASSADALQVALMASPGLVDIHLAAVHAADYAAWQAHGEHWQALDAERAALAQTMQQARDVLAGCYPNPDSVAWWAIKVATLRVCLVVAERFPDRKGWQAASIFLGAVRLRCGRST